MRTNDFGLVVGMAVSAFAACKFPELPPLETDAVAGDGPVDSADVDAPGLQPLTVTVTGAGAISSEPAGIDCGAICSAEFEAQSSVLLVASAAPDSVFEGWSGDCTDSGDCVLTMDGPKTVSALFRVHGAVRWVKQVGLAGVDVGFKSAVDVRGDVVLAGTVYDGTEYDLYAIKYGGADGQVHWSRHFQTVGNAEFFGDLAVDASGNAYVASRLQGNGATLMFDTFPVSGDIFGDVLVLRLAAATGTVEWAKKWGGSSQDDGTAIAVSGNDVFVAGKTSSNPSTFDARTIAAAAGNGFLVRAAASNGSVAQLKLVPGSVDLSAIAVNNGRVAITGAARSSVTIDPGCGITVSGTGNDMLIIDVVDTSLACQWARTYGDMVSSNDSRGWDVAGFPGGGWVLAGTFEGTISGLGASSIMSRGMDDALVARLAADGQPTWVYRYGDVGAETARAVATTADGNVVFAGSFSNSISLGAHTVTGTSNAFVTRMSSAMAPTHEWAVSLGGNDVDAGEHVSLAADGSVHVVSAFTGQTTVGTTSLGAQATDYWVAALVR